MELTTSQISFTTLEQKTETIYDTLKRSSWSIFKMVENELSFKSIFNPKNGTIINTENIDEFKSFQELLRNINNIVYFNCLLLGSFSIFEMAFKKICEFVDEYSCPNHEFKNPNRNILHECRKYLNDSKLINFTKKEIDSKYLILTNFNKVRNIIAHNNGNIISKKNLRIEEQIDYNLFQRLNYLTIMNNGQIYINNEEFIKEFIRESEIFLKLLIVELKNKNFS